jgi:hypothetical protein
MPCIAVYGEATSASARRSADEINAAATKSGGIAAVAASGSSSQSLTLGVPLERPDEPVLCLQEARTHAKSHRGSRRVRGGGATLWQRLTALTPYNPVWSGGFARAAIILPDVTELVEDTLRLAYAPSMAQFVNDGLAEIQSTHSGRAMNVLFVPLQLRSQAPSSSATAAAAPSVQSPVSCLRIDVSTSPQLPYCFLCSKKVRASAASAVSLAPEGSSAKADRAHLSSAALENVQVTGSIDEEGFSSWLSAAFHEVVRTAAVSTGLSSSASGTQGPKRVGHRLGATGLGAAASSAAASSSSRPAPERQCIPLGLCLSCIDVVRRVDEARVAAAPSVSVPVSRTESPPGPPASGPLPVR